MAASRFLPLAAVLCSLFAGCAASGPFPSLAPRPDELTRSEDAVPAPPAPPRPIDLAVMARVNALLADARRGDGAFQAALPGTQQAVSASGAAGSDTWARAQQALSRMEAARSPTTIAAAELDTLARARTEAAASEAELGAITAVIEEIGGLVRSQNQAIARLGEALADP